MATKRSTNDVGVLLLHPEAKTDISYFFAIVDLPQSNNMVISQGGYSAATNTITYSVTYTGGFAPPAGSPLVSYMVPPYLSQNVPKEKVDTLSVNVTIQGGITKKGTVSKQKTVSLFDGLDLAAEIQPVLSPRVHVVQSDSLNMYYFVIVLVRTQPNSNTSNVLTLSQASSTSIQVSFNTPIGKTQNNSVAAAYFIPSSGAFTSVFVNSNAPVSFNYDNPWTV